MKTLKENINEVMNSSKSISAKRNDLKKIEGLTAKDIVTIINTYKALNPEAFVTATTPRRRSVTFAYTFGVEIECYNVERQRMIDEAVIRGINLEYQGYNHTDSRSVFKMVRDGSLSGVNPIECVTPVLGSASDGFGKLNTMCEALNAIDAKVNASCGLHVHIGARGLGGEWYANVFKNYQMLEVVIDTFMAQSRRGDACVWAHTLADHNLVACYSPEQVSRTLNNDRYHKVNPCAWSRHNTIEFRQHSGTTNYKKIEAWVKFCGKLVGWSKENLLTQRVTTIDEIPFLTAAEKAYFKGRANELNRA